MRQFAENINQDFDRIGGRRDGDTFDCDNPLFVSNDRSIFESDGILARLAFYRSRVGLGLYDYVVICDTSNNTPDRIDRNELYIDVAIEPVKAVEFIYIPVRIKNTGSIAAGT